MARSLNRLFWRNNRQRLDTLPTASHTWVRALNQYLVLSDRRASDGRRLRRDVRQTCPSGQRRPSVHVSLRAHPPSPSASIRRRRTYYPLHTHSSIRIWVVTLRLASQFVPFHQLNSLENIQLISYFRFKNVFCAQVFYIYADATPFLESDFYIIILYLIVLC